MNMAKNIVHRIKRKEELNDTRNIGRTIKNQGKGVRSGEMDEQIF